MSHAKIPLSAVLLIACAGTRICSVPALAIDVPESEMARYSAIATDFVTPHTPWARPYAQGKLRGYYFVRSASEGMQTHAREF